MTVIDGRADGTATGAAGGPLRMIWAELGQECQLACLADLLAELDSVAAPDVPGLLAAEVDWGGTDPGLAGGRWCTPTRMAATS